MLDKLMLAASLATFTMVGAVHAQPPADALPLSQILATIEAEADFGYFDEVEWDSDGYWEIEYHRADGAKVEVDVDPLTGQPAR